MSNSPDGEWLYQISLKPSPDSPMINVRAYTARDLAEQVTELAEYAPQIGSRLEEIKAVAALQGSFPGTSRVDDRPAPSRGGGDYDRSRGNSRGNGGNRGGEATDQVCGPHKLPLERRSGTKNGKSWSGLFCTSPRDACSPIWDD